MKNIMKGFLVVIFVFGLAGCDKIFPAKDTATAEKETLKIKGPLLARVNDWVIGVDDFKNYLNSLEPLAKKTGLDINSSEFKTRFLSDLIKAQILAQIAVDRGLDKDPDVVRALRDTRDTLLAAKVRDDLEKRISVSYAQIQAFYEKNKKLITKPQELKIREIAVSSESQGRDINIRILQGESFDTLARQYSILASKDNGGDRGWVSPTPKDIETNRKYWTALATLDKGNVSNVFKSDDGNYYIVKVEDIRGGQEVPLADIEKDLEKALKAEQIETEENKIIDKFKAANKIEKNEDLIK